MKPSTDSFPTILPPWIRDWAMLERDEISTSESNLSIVNPEDLTTLWRLLNSEEVAVKLHSFDERMGSKYERFRLDVTCLLSVTCATYRRAQSQPNLSAADLEQQLKALAASAKKLALDLDRLRLLLRDAINTKYLTDRASSSYPSGFSGRKRAGLRNGAYMHFHPDAPDLTDLLFAFSEDVSEEIDRRRRHNLKSDGGDGASIRYQARRIKSKMHALFGKANNSLIAALLSATNEQDISEDRIKKIKTR